MIVNKCLVNSLFEKCSKTVNTIQKAKIYNRSRIGNRDWVAYGRNGAATYSDDPGYPFPAIRFRENTNELLALREKEKGDWRKLSIEEKKILYRASFRQTLAEVDAPTGEWKGVLGGGLFLVSLGLWCLIFFKLCVYERPITLSDQHRAAQLRKLVELKTTYVSGVSSKWDYENDDWKK